MPSGNRKRQTDSASELSDRAAESVDRRYDATKEVFREREDTDDEDTDDEDRDRDED